MIIISNTTIHGIKNKKIAKYSKKNKIFSRKKQIVHKKKTKKVGIGIEKKFVLKISSKVKVVSK